MPIPAHETGGLPLPVVNLQGDIAGIGERANILGRRTDLALRGFPHLDEEDALKLAECTALIRGAAAESLAILSAAALRSLIYDIDSVARGVSKDPTLPYLTACLVERPVRHVEVLSPAKKLGTIKGLGDRDILNIHVKNISPRRYRLTSWGYSAWPPLLDNRDDL